MRRRSNIMCKLKKKYYINMKKAFYLLQGFYNFYYKMLKDLQSKDWKLLNEKIIF